jgi:hypothetical protein
LQKTSIFWRPSRRAKSNRDFDYDQRSHNGEQLKNKRIAGMRALAANFLAANNKKD